jgi:hypothetical protein
LFSSFNAEGLPLAFELANAVFSSSSPSSSKERSRIEDVTSHHTVVKSSRMRHSRQVGANFL